MGHLGHPGLEKVWRRFSPLSSIFLGKTIGKNTFCSRECSISSSQMVPVSIQRFGFESSKAQTPAVKSQVEGRSFLDFISPADRQRFVDVVQTSSIHESPAGSLSVHLVDSPCEVRLYHARWQQGGFTTIKPWHGWFFE